MMSNLVRIGECKRCGRCCRDLRWLDIALPPVMLEWLKAHEPTVEIQATDQQDIYDVGIPHVCAQLVRGDDGTFGCRLHGDAKPEICRIYPDTPEMCEPHCGFSFAPPAEPSANEHAKTTGIGGDKSE